jgi:hypothetical protein
MLRASTKVNGDIEIVPGLRPPGVYLDYGVIGDLARKERGERVRAEICRRRLESFPQQRLRAVLRPNAP